MIHLPISQAVSKALIDSELGNKPYDPQEPFISIEGWRIKDSVLSGTPEHLRRCALLLAGLQDSCSIDLAAQLCEAEDSILQMLTPLPVPKC